VHFSPNGAHEGKFLDRDKRERDIAHQWLELSERRGVYQFGSIGRTSMRRFIIVAAIAAFASSGAFAQNNAADRPDRNAPATAGTQDQGKEALPRLDYDKTNVNEPSNPAVKTTEGNNPGAPVEGANSFTEDQARSRIESRGFTSVSKLTKDDKGIWRGTAMKDGRQTQVSLDYQGNVVVATN
jgi:hypothetical protein